MVVSFYSCSTSPAIYTAMMMTWNASKISWELSESPRFSSSAGSSSGTIALSLAIDLRAFFVSFTTGGLRVTGLSAFAIDPKKCLIEGGLGLVE